MMILGLEFSSNERSVAVARDSAIDRIEILGFAEERSREVTGMALIDRALKLSGIQPEEITDIILGLGPGSYTGIRSAIAIAQGWQLGRGVRVIGVGSIECLARQSQASGMRGEVTYIVDAQRGDAYQQKFELTEGAVQQKGDLTILSRDAIQKLGPVIGPEASKFSSQATDLYPSAKFLVPFAGSRDSSPAESIEPIYLREVSFVRAPVPRRIE
jgi:tRNA threonylcarbamoyl adenosine modification protein YeaZ